MVLIFAEGAQTTFSISFSPAGCLGITLSFHRQISHRSFQTPKWVEYCLAYCGVLAVQASAPQKASHALKELLCLISVQLSFPLPPAESLSHFVNLTSEIIAG